MIVNLIRESVPFAQAGELACHAEAPGVPAHRVAATPFEEAEREVRRRVLRSLADRANPPTAVVFVRTWEQASLPGDGHCVPSRMGAAVHVAHPAQQMAIDAFRAEQHETEPAVPVRVEVSAEQVSSGGPRRGRRARA